MSWLLAYSAAICFGAAVPGYWLRSERVARAASWLAAIGTGLLAGSLVTRGLEVGHWPLVGRYEFTLCFTLSAALVTILLEWRLKDRAVGTAGLTITLGLMTYALFGIPAAARAPRPLPPTFNSILFQIHVISVGLAYGAFATAAGLGGVYLIRTMQSAASRPKPQERLEMYAWRAVGLGFPLLSVGIFIGAIWAQSAWGNYWNWDPKETWALITWLVYLAYLHARGLRGWRGRRAAWLVVAAFGVVLFTFLGVNWLVRQLGWDSLHVF